jgi:hypothetical protein
VVLGANRPKPGLKAIYEGREARKPGGKYSRPSNAGYFIVLGAIVASLFAYHFVDEHDLSVQKHDVLAQQRAIKSTIGAEWLPLREVIEKYTLDAAGPFKGDFVDSEAAPTRWDFRSMPGLYLRMRLADVKDVASLRRAAAESQKDQFVGCLLRESNAAAARGEPDAGAFPDQPWNLGQAYTATRVLDESWTEGLKAADDKMQVRVYQEQYEKAAKVDMRVAAEMVRQAKFFLLVLDEDPTGEDAVKMADGGAPDEPSIQLAPHWSRVHVLDLRTKGELLRLRREGSASFLFAGEGSRVDDETKNAMQRQVNNCSLAQQVWAAVTAKADGGP